MAFDINIDGRGAHDPKQTEAAVRRAISEAAPHIAAGAVEFSRATQFRPTPPHIRPDPLMGLRDQLAASALIGLLANEQTNHFTAEKFALNAYTLADYMLAQRDKPTQKDTE